MAFPGGPLNGQATAGQPTVLSPPHDPKAPQLSVALNTSPVPPKEDVPELDVDKAATVGKILEQIHGRLVGGLGPVWEGPNGHDLEWDVPKADSKDPNADVSGASAQLVAEETWARFCSEMMLGATYGTSSFYGSKPYWKDQDFFKFFVSDNPVVPLAMACQQLCTFALLSQGRLLVELTSKGNVGVSAGSNAYLPWLYDGPWDKSVKYSNLAAAVKRKALPERGLTPGSMFGWSPGGKGQQEGSHVVFVLRIAASVEKVQFMDTGAVTASAQKMVGDKLKSYSVPRSGLAEDGGSPYSMRNLGVAGNYDDGLFAGQIGVTIPKTGEAIPFVGLGVHKPLSAKVIITGVSLARRARPLGVARLGIFKRPASAGGTLDPDAVLYVSPTLQMHEGDTDNFYISRYLWSLRAIPGYKDLQAIWQISTPLHESVNALRDPTRDVPLKTIFAKTTPELRHCIWLTVERDGRVTYLARFKTETYKDEKSGETRARDATEPGNALGRYGALINKLKTMAHGEHYVSSALGPLDSIPSYFKPW